jgi:hypothetical protein
MGWYVAGVLALSEGGVSIFAWSVAMTPALFCIAPGAAGCKEWPKIRLIRARIFCIRSKSLTERSGPLIPFVPLIGPPEGSRQMKLVPSVALQV